MSDISENENSAIIESENVNSEKYMIFSVLDKLYGFPSRQISEIAIFDAVYPLPLLPPYVLGVINRYSVPYALFDIAQMLYRTPGKRNKILVFKDEIDRVAILIDDISGIADVPEQELLLIERSSESNDSTESISASFNWEGNDVLVLDIESILKRVTQETA
ncbi:MAG: chemotaxis protein CheW [Treponema sp.]|nr:chemotaxis protein CheW [Treponema sp.]